MLSNEIRGTEAWIDVIRGHELPAFAATVKYLEKLANDDTASLPALGKSVLHDQGLTSRILRVVNSASYCLGRNTRVTTVSRAATILGYDTLRHICITAKMIDSMLRNRDVNPPVYERILRLMAKSLHSAMLAKVLIGDRANETLEEVYIAALLHDLGEIAFWSAAGPTAEKLDLLLQQNPKKKKRELVRQLLGTSFEQLSIGLASVWNMGDLLVKSIEDPERRTPEMRAVALACEYSEYLTLSENKSAPTNCVKGICQLLECSQPKARRKILDCTVETIELAREYGARPLIKYLFNGAKTKDTPVADGGESDPLLQLKMLRELTQIANEQGDINELINTTIEGLHRGVAMDRVLVFMLSPNKTKLLPRFVSCTNAEPIEKNFVFPLSKQDTVFDEACVTGKAFWLDAPSSLQWRHKLTPALAELSLGEPFFVAPMQVKQTCIGLIYADRANSESLLRAEDFTAFQHFVGQLSLCLSLRLASGQSCPIVDR